MPGFFDFYEKKQQGRRPAQAAQASPVQTVSQLTQTIAAALRAGVPQNVQVRGEVSNFKRHDTSGHLYFTLKDAQATINCVMFRSDAEGVKFEVDDGQEVVATGRVGVYAQRGQYQLTINRLEPVGQGALELAFRQLYARLAAEGLFDPGRKKPLPAYPVKIAIVTSTQTAAIQDIYKVLRRFGFLRLMVYHVPVQGQGAAVKIAEAIADLNRWRGSLGIEVIMLARGGGSLEDLWPFNEEVLARAIAASEIPTITGVGHEIDTTIADLAADVRAHTPTEAAQVITAQWRTAGEMLDAWNLQLTRQMRQMIAESRQWLTNVERNSVFTRPVERINLKRQFLDDRQRALVIGLQGVHRRGLAKTNALAMKLEQNRPTKILARMRERLSRTINAFGEKHPRHRIQLLRQRVESLATHLNAVAPEQVLKRGYTITTLKKGGQVVRSAAALKEGDRLITRFADGPKESVVNDGRQGSLFE